MAFYGSNCNNIVILIVFYLMMNLENAKCPTVEQIIQCESDMKLYCGYDISKDINCAKEAIASYEIRVFNILRHEASYEDESISRNSFSTEDDEEASVRTLDEKETNSLLLAPKCVVQYFINNIEPFVTGKISSDEFCISDEYLKFFEWMDSKYSKNKKKHLTTTWCQDRLAYVKEFEILDFYFKGKEFMDDCDTNFYLTMYLRVLQERISLESDVPRERISPADFCQTFEDY